MQQLNLFTGQTKTEIAIDFIREHEPPDGYMLCYSGGKDSKVPLTHRLLGVRAEESANRAKQGWINQFTKKRINYHPIFDWLEWEVWDYIEYHGLPYCSLYDEGFSRLGCVVCPLRSAKDKAIWRKRFPAEHALFEKCCYRWWERKGFHRQRVRGKEMLFEEFMENWYNQ